MRKRKSNESKNVGRLVLETVMVRKDDRLRIGQDLLKDWAGRRDLRFGVTWDGEAMILQPRTDVGYVACYQNPASKSPVLNLKRFYHLVSMEKPKPGLYRAEVQEDGSVVCFLTEKGRV
jgi:hypothetical protein